MQQLSAYHEQAAGGLITIRLVEMLHALSIQRGRFCDLQPMMRLLADSCLRTLSSICLKDGAVTGDLRDMHCRFLSLGLQQPDLPVRRTDWRRRSKQCSFSQTPKVVQLAMLFGLAEHRALPSISVEHTVVSLDP